MDVFALILVFAAAAGVSYAVVAAFSVPIELALRKVLAGDFSLAWAKYARFAVFVTGLAGGLRLKELEALATPAADRPIDASRCLLELFRTTTGSLTAASSSLLVVFGATLVAWVALQLYERMPWKLPQPDGRRERAEPGRS